MSERHPVRSPSPASNLPFSSVGCVFQPSQLTWLASAPLRARAPGPVSGRLSRTRPGEGTDCCPRFPAAFRLPALATAAILPPPGLPPLLRSAYRQAAGCRPRTARDTTFRTLEMRPGWAPSLPRDRRCSHGPLTPLVRRLPPHNGTGPKPRHIRHLSEAPSNEASTRVHAIRPPGLPLARDPQVTRGRLGFFPGLRTHADRIRARTPGRGQALSTSLESCR